MYLDPVSTVLVALKDTQTLILVVEGEEECDDNPTMR
jgi:hypothetical protein